MVSRATSASPQPLTTRQVSSSSGRMVRSNSVSKLPLSRGDGEALDVKHVSFRPRRAQSSLRPQTMRMQPVLRPQPQLPRANSTGRVRPQPALQYPVDNNDDEEIDPDAMTRAILDMREQRSRSSSRQRSRSRDRKAAERKSLELADLSQQVPLQRSQSQPVMPKAPQQQQPVIQRSLSSTSSTENQAPMPRSRNSSPAPRPPTSPDTLLSPRSHEEERARSTLKQAEDRIDGLLLELEEMRFFREIEEADPSPPQKRLGAMRRHADANDLLTPRGDAVPAVIRAASPGRRLPPPPNDLSPRKISKMDRTELELETQTLCRQVQILTQEKQALEAEIEVFKVQMQEQADSGGTVRELESHLRHVSTQLRQAKEDFEQAREQLLKQFDIRLQEKTDGLQKIEFVAEAYKTERDKYRKELEKRKAQYTERKEKLKEDLKMERETSEAREAVLELQLSEAKESIEALKKQVEEKKQEIDSMREELAQAGQSLAEMKDSRDEAYEVRLSSLEEELKLAQDKLEKMSDEKDLLQMELDDLREQLEKSNEQADEHLKLISDMTERLDSVHSEYRSKFGELKEIYEAKEKRRLDEMVMTQSTEVQEFERRIRALQEQLSHQTDRHHAEIRQKDAELETTWQAREAKLRLAIEAEHQDVARALKDELDALRKDFEQADAERMHMRAEMEGPQQDQLKEWQQQDSLREKEIRRLRDRQESLTQEIADKEAHIKELTSRMSERESRHVARVSQLEAQHADELIARDEALATQKREYRVMEVKLQNQISCHEADMNEIQALMESRVSDLQRELTRTQSSLSEARMALQANESSQKKMEELQAALERVRTEISTERTMHESCETEMRVEIAKLEGKLRASESSLRQKRELIEELEDKLRNIDSSKVSIAEMQSQIESLQKELVSTKQELEEERASVELKDDALSELRRGQEQLKTKTEALEEAESTIDKLQKSIADAEDEKISTVVQLTQLQSEFEAVSSRLAEYETKVADNGLLTEELRKREDQAKSFSEQYSSTLQEIQGELRNERQSKQELVEKLRELEADLEFKEHQVRRLPKLQEQLKEMISGREDLQVQLGKVEAELLRKDKQIKQASDKLKSTTRDFEEKLEEQQKAKESVEDQLRAMQAEMKLKAERAERFDRQLPEIKAELTEKSETIANLKAELDRASLELRRAKEQLGDLSGGFSVELQAKVEQLTKTKATLEARVSDLEEEREDREKQVRESSERYSNQIVDLQMQVEELSRTKDSLAAKLSQAELDLEKKEEAIAATASQFSGDVQELRTKLSAQLSEKSKLEERLRSLGAKLAEQEKSVESMASTLTSEMQTKLESETKENRSLRLKIGDVEAELERKEKQVKDIVNRYSKEISELKDKLEDETKATAALRKELDQVREDADSLSCLSFEQTAVKEKLVALEKKLEVERALASDAETTRRRLEEELKAAESSKTELEERLDKANAERSEVITALEEVINEVQSREEEIDSLASILRKRDEELDHAKMIATKALASAQDMKKRYKERDDDRQSELMAQIKDLNANIDFLTKKNDNLQRRTSRLEEELTTREGECADLRVKLRRLTRVDRPSSSKLDNFVSLSDNHEKKSASGSSGGSSAGGQSHPDHDGFQSLGDSPTASMGSADGMSTQSTEMGSGAAWLNELEVASVDSSDSVSFAGIRTDPGTSDPMSRRSIERDALRKYVRKRYLRTKTSM